MASESTSVTLTLHKGPITFTVGGLTFRQNEPQHLTLNEQNREIIDRLKRDPNFRYEGPSKKAKKVSAPPPPPEDTDEGEESEEEADADDDSEESESKSEEHSRASLRGLSKKELLKIAKSLRVKNVDVNMPRSAIADAIIETQDAKG